MSYFSLLRKRFCGFPKTNTGVMPAGADKYLVYAIREETVFPDEEIEVTLGDEGHSTCWSIENDRSDILAYVVTDIPIDQH